MNNYSQRSVKQAEKEVNLSKNCQKKRFSAFSLIEFAIVLTVVAVAVSGVMSLKVSDRKNSQMDKTNLRMAKINKAFEKFVLVNKRMPCPASLQLTKRTTLTGVTDYGDEGGAPGECSDDGTYESSNPAHTHGLIYGAIPVRALGLPNNMANDAYGERLIYIIDKEYTDSATFATDDSTRRIIINDYNTSSLEVVASDVMFLIMSYGANKMGSFSASSTTQNKLSSDIDELYNGITIDSSANTASFTNEFIKKTRRSGSKFDDILFYKSRKDFLISAKAEFVVNKNITSDSKLKP